MKNDPALKELSTEKWESMGIIPYNFYTTNYESVLVNSYFAGKVHTHGGAEILISQAIEEMYGLLVIIEEISGIRCVVPGTL